MERLTQWIDKEKAITRVDLRHCGHERCTTQLARYEDTGLTPEQIDELKERDKSKPPIYQVQGDERYEQEPEWWECPNCAEVYDMDDDYDFCPNCGQRIRR